MARQTYGRDRPLRPRDEAAKILLSTLVATILCSATAEAAACLSSAEEVRKVTPKAWPKWTYGPDGERCWYSGPKPVFAKTPQQSMPPAPRESDAPMQSPALPDVTTATDAEENHTDAEPVNRPWALEYRWSESFPKDWTAPEFRRRSWQSD